jgi:trans-aconitate methyltransferase
MTSNADAYDRIASRWNAASSEFRARPFLDELLALSVSRPNVLDVGCGTGRPVDAYLLERGCTLTGIDVSAAMLDIARRDLPGGTFLRCDVLDFEPQHPFQAIVAWDSMFHVPRRYHRDVFERLHSWLTDAGVLLVSLGGSAWEGTTEMLGETFFFSGFEPEQSLGLLREVGFEVFRWEIDDPSSRGHLVALARLRSSPSA